MEKQTKTQKFLESLMPEIKTEVGFNSQNLIQAAAIIFIAATFIFLAYFAIKKTLKL